MHREPEVVGSSPTLPNNGEIAQMEERRKSEKIVLCKKRLANRCYEAKYPWRKGNGWKRKIGIKDAEPD